MRKKSHILLARYLADQMQTTASLQSHRKAFCLGSILPDIKPSFITRRHEFYGTFEDVKNRMKELADIRPDESNQRVYWRRFGEVIHYMADYFTFPHNKTYTGSFSQHNHYEKVLKNRLKECIQQGEAHAYLEPAIRFADFPTLIDYIEATHEKYLNKLRSVEEDIRFILNMCFQVVRTLQEPFRQPDRDTLRIQEGCVEIISAQPSCILKHIFLTACCFSQLLQGDLLDSVKM